MINRAHLLRDSTYSASPSSESLSESLLYLRCQRIQYKILLYSYCSRKSVTYLRTGFLFLFFHEPNLFIYVFILVLYIPDICVCVCVMHATAHGCS